MKGRVLLVEDVEREREQAGAVLRRAGFIVDETSNAEDALRQDSEHDYDAAVVDVELDPAGRAPNGIALVAELREKERDYPVLIMTGLSSPVTKLAGFRAGANGYLVKSPDRHELDRMLDWVSKATSTPRASRQTETLGEKELER